MSLIISVQLKIDSLAQMAELTQALKPFLLDTGTLPVVSHEPPMGLHLPADVCPVHGVPFKRHERNGKSWYSHALPDGTWCRKGGVK
jgi:hypothetical protein